MNNYKRTKYGKFMYNVCYKGGLFLNKHRWLYYVLASTWGILMTLVGLLISVALLIAGKKPIKYGGIYYFKVGKNWGGLEMGLMFLTDEYSGNYDDIKNHELGHSYQNAILGPLMPFLVSIPSAIRYWYRNFSKKPQPDYDAIWFEGNATDIGYAVIKK